MFAHSANMPVMMGVTSITDGSSSKIVNAGPLCRPTNEKWSVPRSGRPQEADMASSAEPIVPLTPTAPPRRRRRWLLRLAGLTVLMAAAIWFAPAIVAHTGLRDSILNRILSGPILAGTVSSESASLGWFSPVAFHGVTIVDPSGQVVAQGGSLTSSKSLLELARADREYGEFTLSGTTLTVACRADGTNIEDLIAPLFAPSEEPSDPVGVVFRIADSKVILTETDHPDRPLETFDLAVSVTPSPSEPIRLTASVSGPGRVGAEFVFGTPSTAKLTAEGFPIETVSAVVRRFAADTNAAGRLTTDVTLTWDETSLSVAGRTDVADLDLAAPWLGPDRLKLTRAGLPAKLSLNGDILTIDSAKLACDVGIASASGVIDLSKPITHAVDRPDQKLSAEVDLAKLAALLPNLVQIREGTELQSGRVTLAIATRADPKGGTGWEGSLDATSLKGVREGQPLAWDEPLQVSFAGRTRPDGLPEFDRLECRSDFVGLAVRGSPERLEGSAKLDLDRLSNHLAEFVDLGGATLAGTADVTLIAVRTPESASLSSTAKLVRFVLDDGRGGRLSEPALDLTLAASGQWPNRLDTGSLQITAGEDRLEVKLLEPIRDLRSIETGKVNATLAGNLARWQSRVGRWVALPAGWSISGNGDVAINAELRPGREAIATATANLTRFSLNDGDGRRMTEPTLLVKATGSGRFPETGPARLERGQLQVTAAGDTAEVALLEPIADLEKLTSGKLSAKLGGDLSRWRNRLGPLAQLPADWILAGTGTIATNVNLASDTIQANEVQADLTRLQFHGFGLLVDEAAVRTECGIALDRKTGTIAVSDLKLASETASLATRSLSFTPNESGNYHGGGAVAVSTRLDRALKTAGLVIDDPALAVSGLASGTIGLTLKPKGSLNFDADTTVTKLLIGPANDPTWSEPSVKVAGKGDWNLESNKLSLTSFAGGRDGLVVAGKGSVDELNRAVKLDLEGTITYDLAKLEPQLREFLGKGATVKGMGTKPFRVSGPLVGGQSLAVNVGGLSAIKGRRPSVPPTQPAKVPTPVDVSGLPLNQLNGNAAVGWEMIKAFGFDVGPAEMSAAMANGTVQLTPLDATFGGGRVRVNPTLKLNSPNYDLTIAPGRIVEKANLTPDALDGTLGALGYALPALADVAQAEGLISFEVADGTKIPLGDVNKTSLTGTLTVHSATVSPGPLVTEILTLLNAERKVLATATEQRVPIVIKDGIVYHDNFKLQVEKTTVTSRGGVGLDGRLGIQVEIPFPPGVAEQVFKGTPRIRDALLRQTIRINVTGTIDKPQLDQGTFRNTVQQLVREATKDAAGNLLGDLLKKGLAPPPPPQP